MHIDSLPSSMPLVKTWDSLAETHRKLNSGGAMKHIHSMLILKPKYS